MIQPLAAAQCWRSLEVRRWGAGEAEPRGPADAVAAEVPVAISYNGVSHVVMMMSPADLEDFAVGFSLSEGIAGNVGELRGIEVFEREQGLEVAVELAPERDAMLRHMRRNLSGRTGCGLCGAESLEQAIRPVPRLAAGQRFSAAAIDRAVATLAARQPLASATGGAHAAAWCAGDGTVGTVREDVGRHNALDKLIGALARAAALDGGGFVLVSSRASYELVTKCARAGLQLLVAVSAPTTLAVELAQQAGLGLVAFARPGRLTVYSGAERMDL